MYERNQVGLASGNFSHIERASWQALSRETWMVPTIQQAVISGSRGVFVTLTGVALTWVAHAIQPAATPAALVAALLVGTVTAAYDFQDAITARFDDIRAGELAREIYEKQNQTAGAASQENLTIEQITRRDSGAIRQITYDDLPIQIQDLARAYLAWDAGDLKMSKRGLAAFFNCSIDKASDTLAALEDAQYIFYADSRNSPDGAAFTVKGVCIIVAFLSAFQNAKK